jgi:anti-sigma B factor antagonist
MPFVHRQVDSAAVIAISGRLTFGPDAERLESMVKELAAQGGRKFVFDVSELHYTDSSGVGALVACLTEIRRTGGEMRLAGASPRILRILAMTGVDKLMQLYPTVDAAVAG